ncbi:magnesium and cobalt transport protein CorA [Rhodococcus sp. NPDC003318]|uniref:magnesium and cobalt transport protein CorA n=1 Tax=Rhodococcus sp. NPDC003318 TaxID=3364503 RepID=UPI0036B86B0B
MPPIPSLRPSPKQATPRRVVPVPAARAIVDCAVYVDGHRLPGRYTHAAALDEVRERGEGFVWVGLHAPDERQMNSVAEVFGLHELMVEDAVHAHQRPKLEIFDDVLFLVLRTVNYVEHESISTAHEIVETGEIMIFVGRDFVVTVRHGDHSGLSGVRAAMDAQPQRLALGPTTVMHAIADHVVDTYLAVTDCVERDVDQLEEDVFSPHSNVAIEQIYLLKREIVELRKSVAPLAAPLQRLGQDSNIGVPKEIRRYMRDVQDHHIIVAERVSEFDEVLSTLVEAALAKVAVQQNTDMRKISAWVAIAAVPTMVAGIYGMNFEHMPELQWTYGYPAVVGGVVAVCAGLFVTFRRNNWL